MINSVLQKASHSLNRMRTLSRLGATAALSAPTFRLHPIGKVLVMQRYVKQWRVGSWLMAVLMLSSGAHAAVIVTGKVTSKVTATVAHKATFEVTDDKGGWFEQGLDMQQRGGWETPYEVDARLRVTSTDRNFQVKLDEPLEIRNQTNPAQMFQRPAITLGPEGGAPKTLLVGQNTTFQNPEPPPDADSIGFYTLSVSAYPPAGDFKSTSGTYGGVLSMTFEPIVKAP